jgi:hypothetical protein
MVQLAIWIVSVVIVVWLVLVLLWAFAMVYNFRKRRIAERYERQQRERRL